MIVPRKLYNLRHRQLKNSFLPSGDTAGSPEEALDCACGLYLNDPTS